LFSVAEAFSAGIIGEEMCHFFFFYYNI